MKTGKYDGFWKALTAALLLHALVLLLPLTRMAPPVDDTARIELDLVAFLPETPTVVIQEPEPEPPAEPEPAIREDSVASQSVEPLEPIPLQPPVEVEPDPPTIVAREDEGSQKDIILSRQFITEEPVIDQLFGRPVFQKEAPRKEFHFPDRPDMLAMLNRPMQDLPFEYTPGLVRFAYAPGVKGDLQRFWDVITPEFGWRTDNGTEFRCVWLLVIGACGWK